MQAANYGVNEQIQKAMSPIRLLQNRAAFFEDRAQGTFISKAEGQRRTVDMIDRKRRALGL